MFEQIESITDWEDIEIHFKQYQVAFIKFTQFYEKRNYRLVIMREKTNDTQLDIFTGDRFTY